MARAKEYLEQAIALDPMFAQPYSELARLYVSLAVGGVRLAAEVMPPVEAWAKKALEIDFSLAEAHSCLGLKAFLFDYDWNEAERRFSLALAREPVSATTCLDYTLFSVMRGRPRDAEARMRRVVEADPLMLFHRLHLSLILMTTGRDQEAERELRHVLEIDEHYFTSWLFLGHVLLARGETTDAVRCYEKAYALLTAPRTTGSLAGALALTGDTKRADELLQTLGPPTTQGVPAAWMMWHLIQGETDKAADWFEKALDQRDVAAGFYVKLGLSGAFRRSSRWPALAKRMNLPESAW